MKGSRMRKVVQIKLYDFLNTKVGACTMVVGSFLCILSLVSCVHSLLGDFQRVEAKSSSDGIPQPCHLIEGTCAARFSDNIVGRSFEEELCAPTIDVVYTWVNGSDPRLQAELREYKRRLGIPSADELISSNNSTKADGAKGNSNRYRDNQELRYSLRSIWRFAPWVRKIFIVTNYQVPYWLNIDHPKIEVVTHHTIFSNKSHLPVFSSPAIESHLHQIPGLAKKFIYFNDDVMLGNTIWPSDFYTNTKGQKVYLSWDIPQCAPGCPEAWLADKYCDTACNTSMCNWDEGDCRLVNGTRLTSWHNSQQANPSAVSQSAYVPRNPATPQRPATGGGGAEEKSSKCHRFCPDSWIGDKVCDSSCNRVECAFDAGDCGVSDIEENILGLTLQDDKSLTSIPPDAKSFYVNLTGMFDMVLDASHDNQEFVRTAIITQELHILVFLLKDKPESAAWLEAIEVYLEGEYESQIRNVTFLIVRDHQLASAAADIQAAQASRHSTQPWDEYQKEPLDSEVLPPIPTISPASSTTASSLEANVEEEPEPTDPGVSEASKESAATEASGGSRTLLWVEREREGGLRYEPTGDLFEVIGHVTSVPSADGLRAIPREEWTEEDRQLADQIGIAKRKILGLELVEEALEEEKAIVYREHQQGYRKTGVVMPRDMERRVASRIKGWLEEEMMAPAGGPAGRRLLEDTFGNSLRFVNSLYRARYGSEQRKAPAHMPHMIDREIMHELQDTFPDQFEATSSHRFRDSEDMQFSFSYFYYLMNEKPPFDLNALFTSKLDLNKDGKLDLLEIRHLCLLLMPGKPTTHGLKAKMAQILDDLEVPPAPEGTDPAEELGLRVKSATITVEAFQNSPRAMEDLKKYQKKTTKYKHELMSLNEVEFFMVPDDYDTVQERLDHIMVKAPKFICLNDDMNKTHDPPKRTLKALYDFYETYYPDATPFELPQGEPNPYLHFDELMEYKQREHRDNALEK
ncbi:hypothetical protein AAMO2058_000890500 [Amorphochlora amoebiformis]|mmetsp:Transcript_28182/g.44847  ORF Transcript_28182/g.44847 Transcript_28182/m.44847 type:complete len:973 (-) Transcript_28182:36-2954(-)